MDLDRRTFLKTGTIVGGGGLAIWLGGTAPAWRGAESAFAAATQTLHLRITDAVKEMATHNAVNEAECYFWIFRVVRPGGIQAEVPGPNLFCRAGDVITVTLDNASEAPSVRRCGNSL